MRHHPTHGRHSTRLRAWDYASSGAYFVTVCSFQRAHLFGEIVDGEMQPNGFGQIVLEEWQRTQALRENVKLDEFVMMPNHVHGIIWILNSEPQEKNEHVDVVGARRASPLRGRFALPNGPKSKSLGAVVGSFKSAVTKRINETRGVVGVPVWQRNYWDRVIRNEAELEQVREYVVNNSLAWDLDDLNLKNLNGATA